MGCFHQLNVCSRGRGKINKYTNMQTTDIHTHIFLEKNFKKPGMCPQPAYSQLWEHAWFNEDSKVESQKSDTVYLLKINLAAKNVVAP